MMTEAQGIAKKIRDNDKWDLDDCKALCELAGMAEEWEAADGDNFEQVIKKAADSLGVEIF